MKPLNKRLLTWYDQHARTLPWRVSPQEGKLGVVPDPYHVWLSEVMLQQTTVAAVKSYFEKFVTQWPSVDDLAAAEDEDVMKAWAGLGYYSRARNLIACARVVSNEMGGRFPRSARELQQLPGIGPYTSAAIATIAFGQHDAVVDGNIERVSTRHTANSTPLPKAKSDCASFMQLTTPKDRPGDFVQAMMDLGATICSPKSPACALCPINEDCQAYSLGKMLDFPVKPAKKSKPTRVGAAFVQFRQDGAIWLTKRPNTGLLGGMSVVPSTQWSARQDGAINATAAPVQADWASVGSVRHTFTHFDLELTVWISQCDQTLGEGWWSAPDDIHGEALPSLMKKVIAKALDKHTRD